MFKNIVSNFIFFFDQLKNSSHRFNVESVYKSSSTKVQNLDAYGTTPTLWMEYTAEKTSIYGQAVPGLKFGDTIMYI
jgi:hypothetical protein